MIITCPSCSVRYRVSEDKVQGRGARITCPTCAHRYVVYRGDGQLVVGQNEQRAQGVPVTFARNGELRKQNPMVEEEEAPTTLMAHGSTPLDRRAPEAPAAEPAQRPAPAPAPAPVAQQAPAQAEALSPVWIVLAVAAIALGVGMMISTLLRS